MNRIIYKKIANKLNLPINKVQEVYTYYWKFYKDTLKEMPLRTDITKEEFMVRLNCYNETYKNSLGAFDKLIIKPAIKELEKGYFKKIVCNKIKNNPYDKKQITGFQLLYDDSNRNQENKNIS